MIFADAFQTDAFQSGAFQLSGGSINTTGSAAVADFRADERNRKSQDARERASRDNLIKIIGAAFDGKPPAREVEEGDPAEDQQFADYSTIHDALLRNRVNRARRQHRSARKALHDSESLEILLMVI